MNDCSAYLGSYTDRHMFVADTCHGMLELRELVAVDFEILD